MTEQNWLEEGWFYHNHAWHLLHEIIKLIIEVDNVETLLDFGAGTGIMASVIKALFPEIKVEVCDISENSRPFWERRGLEGFIYTGYIHDKYDVIITSHTIEHIERPDNDINNLFNSCNKRIIIAVPDGDVHFYDHKIIFNRTVLKDLLCGILYGEDFEYRSFPVYHLHMNNLMAVIDK